MAYEFGPLDVLRLRGLGVVAETGFARTEQDALCMPVREQVRGRLAVVAAALAKDNARLDELNREMYADLDQLQRANDALHEEKNSLAFRLRIVLLVLAAMLAWLGPVLYRMWR